MCSRTLYRHRSTKKESEMLRSIDFKTMPYLFTDKAGTCLSVQFDEMELDGIYK